MTNDEFKIIVKGLKSAYPSPNFLPDDYSVQLWYKMLGDLDYKTVQAAVYKYICSNKFPPTIADMRDKCLALQISEPNDWLSAWSLVLKCIDRFGIYQGDRALKRIGQNDPIAKSVVERMGWRNLCMTETPSIERASFRQCYETIQKREIENAKLPSALREKIQKMANGFNGKMLQANGKED